MKFTKLGRAAVVAAAGALLLSSCAANEPAPGDAAGGASAPASTLSGDLAGAGASSMGAAQTAWIAGFQTANPDVNITYDPAGSGAGREQFMAGGVAFAGSDAYLKDEELAGEFAACAADTLPVDLPILILLKLVGHPLLTWVMLRLLGNFDRLWVYTAVLIASLPMAPRTTGPYWQPMRTSIVEMPLARRSAFHSLTIVAMARAQRRALAASSPAGAGTPNVAMMQSPI